MSASVALYSMINLAVAILVLFPVIGKSHGSATLIEAASALSPPPADARPFAPIAKTTAANAITEAAALARIFACRCIIGLLSPSAVGTTLSRGR
jgi:hypothetical protein